MMNTLRSAPASFRVSPTWRLAAVLWLMLLAFGLRLYRLDFQPLWGDEGWSFYFAWMSPGQLAAQTALDIHPPLYYLLLSGWLGLVGSTPAAGRLLSILIGTLLVPLAYRLAGRLFGRAAGLFSAGLVALAPLAIYYSQEVRMYGLVTCLGLASMYFFAGCSGIPRRGCAEENDQPPGRAWGTPAGYLLTTLAALYTMYYAVLLIVAQLAYLLALVLANRQRPGGRPAISTRIKRTGGALLGVGLLYLPWAAYAGTKLAAYVQGKQAAEGYTPLGLAQFVGSHLIAFSLGHLSPAAGSLAWVSLLFGVLACLGVHYRRETGAALGAGRGAWLVAGYLLVPLGLGYLINLVYPFAPAYFERTLLLAAPAWWVLVGAGLAWLWERSRLRPQRRWLLRRLLVGLSVLLGLAQAAALFGSYSLPRYSDADYRGLLSLVRAQSTDRDVLLASYQWQLGLYHAYLPDPHPQFYVVPGWGETWAADPVRMRSDLEALVSRHPRLWFPAYQSLGRLWETQVEATLNRLAFPAGVDWSIPSTKLTLYGWAGGLAPAALSLPQGPVDQLNFGNQLALEQAEVGAAPLEAGRGIIPVRLTWQQLAGGGDDRVVLRLTDAAGHTWASRDSRPQGGEASFAALSVGQQLVDQHGLLIPAGTPPGEYQLRLSLHPDGDERPLDVLDAQSQPQGVEATLATVQVQLPAIPLLPEALPVQYPLSASFDGRLRLLGYSLSDGPFRAGDRLSFSLFWQALSNGEYPFVVFAQLQDAGGQPVAMSETPPVYPADRWPAGMLLRDPHQIPLPASLPAGDYQLAVGLLWPDRTRLRAGWRDQVVLTGVRTTQRPHDFSAPDPQHRLAVRFGDGARLAGYDLPQANPVRAGQSLVLVLHWQALQSLVDSYSIFVHLVDAGGHIVGQRDQLPGNGEFPTTSWIAGEYLTDRYVLPVHPETPAGTYRVEVGLYTPQDGVRLPVFDELGRRLGDRLLLGETPCAVVRDQG
jgi:4-amino-4-deoxy-L-arabinose transferase-like glycosyltransferase